MISNEKKEDLWNKHHQFIGFWVSIIICISIGYMAMKCTGDSYRAGQQRILKAYDESLAMIDSLQKCNEDALNRVLTEREKTIRKIMSDTLIDSIQGLCLQQKEAVKKYVRPYLEITTRELDIKERLKTSPTHEIQLLRDEIKSLLQLEFNKMQNEYESLEIWAAILTLVFLIFSFYSFFKTEHLEEQGRQALGRINGLEERGRSIMDEMDKDRRAKVSEADDAIGNLKKETSRSLREVNRQIAEIKKENQIVFEEQIDRMLKGFNENMKSQKVEFDKLKDEIRKSFESYREQLDDQIASINGKVDQDIDLGTDDGRED